MEVSKPIQVECEAGTYIVSKELFGTSQRPGIRVQTPNGGQAAKLMPNGGQYVKLSISDYGHILDAKDFYGHVMNGYISKVAKVLEKAVKADQEDPILASSLILMQSLEGVVGAQ